MINFRIYPDSKLKDFVESANFKELEDDELILLKQEIVKGWGRELIPVPLSLVREIHLRKIKSVL